MQPGGDGTIGHIAIDGKLDVGTFGNYLPLLLSSFYLLLSTLPFLISSSPIILSHLVPLASFCTNNPIQLQSTLTFPTMILLTR